MHALKWETSPHLTPHDKHKHAHTHKHHQKLRVHVECDLGKWEAGGELTSSESHHAVLTTRQRLRWLQTHSRFQHHPASGLCEMINLAGVRWVSPTVLVSCRLQSAGSTEGQCGRLMAMVTELEAGPLEETAVIRTSTLSNTLTWWSHAVY